MPVVYGLGLSFQHNQNGMTLKDMEKCVEAAKSLNEVIIFRSTGPWAKRWINRGYPTKNFHVKGKSSDWGPHAGLVPYDGTYSKVGYDKEKAHKGTDANNDGIKSGFAGKAQLILSRDQIDEQNFVSEGRPARTALMSVLPVSGSDDLTLAARRSGDGLPVNFLAKKMADGRYAISVYPTVESKGNPKGLVANSVLMAQDRARTGAAAAIPFEVMTSLEVGAGQAMTGDYDLFAVCPTWADYGSLSSRLIKKEGIALMNGTLNKGQAFRPGVGMDNVLDARLSTGGTAATDFRNRVVGYRNHHFQNRVNGRANDASSELMFKHEGYKEHGDMGNLTPRILRCINTLNALMGATGDKGALRRVHHNAESHRFRLFGALSAKDMVTMKDGEQYGDGFPLTVFQPKALADSNKPAARYGEVCTLESLAEFHEYAAALAESGYYVPKNWVWNMHVRPSVRADANALKPWLTSVGTGPA